MSCTDIADSFLRRRVAVLDVRSRTWTTARAELLPPGYTTATCLHRLAAAGRIRRLKRGLYIVVDAVRETPPVAMLGVDARLSVIGEADGGASALKAVMTEAPDIVLIDANLPRPGGLAVAAQDPARGFDGGDHRADLP